MKHLKNLLILIIILIFSGCKAPKEKIVVGGYELGEFGAFYTKINSGEEFEKFSRTGDFADIIVDLEKGNKFVFWRGSSFLPYLETPKGKWYVEEIIPRKGDGTDLMPDRTNAYSVVKITRSDEDGVVIHWRYLPDFIGGNPQLGVHASKFIDEYFIISPNGDVKRTIKKGTPRIDEWNDPDNQIVQTFTLSENGIENVERMDPKVPQNRTAVKGNPVIPENGIQPSAWWNFNEALGDETTETISGFKSEIDGNKSLWRRGVSGTALQFDGYTSKIALPADKAPKMKNAITLEGWMAIGAYPWSYVPLVQQADDVPEELERFKGQRAGLIGEEDEDLETSDFDFVLMKEDDRGFFFGLDGLGNPTFKLRVGNVWEELVTDFHLERRTWYHLAATFDQVTGLMKVYVNGEEVGQKQAAKAEIEFSTKDVQIGQGKERRPIKPVRMNTFSDSYSFDGLIDEVKIYNTALTPEQVKQAFMNYDSNRSLFAEVDMDKRVLPEGDGRGKFGAYYSHLKFYDIWDNLWRFSEDPDVVVEFDTNPSKFIFWRGVGYIPMMVNEKGQWYSNEFNETWNKSGGEGCQEPMSDKESYNNHARIIENTPARVVVQWRYPLIDVNHVMANFDPGTGWCDWSDWYYYIYPDGVAVKTMHLWTDGERNHEWQESMAIFGPDQHPEQIINTKDALTMLNLNGDYKVYDWVNGPPDNVLEPAGQCIQYINYTGEYKPVTIGDFEWSNVYGGELTPYAIFPTWNHWPVAQMPSDGRYASFPDRTAHSSLTHVPPVTYKEVLDGPTPYYQKLLMEGMLNLKPEELVPLAKSWMKYANITDMTGAEGSYDPGQRAYTLKLTTSPVNLTINGSNSKSDLQFSFYR